jgi:hypothetical protein
MPAGFLAGITAYHILLNVALPVLKKGVHHRFLNRRIVVQIR